MKDKTITLRHERFRRPLLILGVFTALSILLMTAGCNDDDDMDPVDQLPELTGKQTVYNLVAANNSGIAGTIVFAETTDYATLITVSMSGGTQGGTHPIHIHENSATAGGGIVIELGEVDGSKGSLVVEISETDDGSNVSYDDLINFDGHINIHDSPQDLANLVAQTDIGGNVFTGENEDFDLFGILNQDVKGEVSIHERKNGKTLVVIKLEDDDTDTAHPTHIHRNTAVEGGPIAISLNAVDAVTKMSFTDINSLDDGTPVSYSALEDFDGYVNVHLSSDALSTLVVQGDFGQNELTSDDETYDLLENGGSGVSGSVVFTKRRNDETLITITLAGTPESGTHPAHIHQNPAADGGPIILDLNAVNGDTGMSKTQVTVLNDGTPVTYDDLLDLNGHINVHLSNENLATVVARGNIGVNAQ